MTTIELLKQCLTYYFTEHSPEKLCSILTEDIHCYGLAYEKDIENIELAKTLLQEESYQQFMQYTCSIQKETEITPDSAVLHFSLHNKDVTVQYRLSGSSRETAQGRRLYLLDFSMRNPKQTLTMFSDMARERRVKLGHELLNASMPGGIMGGYLEAGFPFYCINSKMLQYLGYSSEEAFVQDIGGLIDNCIHPEDRAYVNTAVMQQLAADGEYQVEYRIRRQDTNYIWVHDIGRCVQAEDGRDVIISACYDITSEKEHTAFIQGMVDTMNCSMATYSVSADGFRLIPIYLSPKFGFHLEMSREEYQDTYAHNAMDSIYPDDRIRIAQSVMDVVRNNSVVSSTFRVFDHSNGFVWTNASYSKHGEKNGIPIIRAVFTPVSMEYEMQLQALSQENTGICVIDADTDELYYANPAIFYLHGVQPHVYTGQKCFEAFMERTSICSWCSSRGELTEGDSAEQVVLLHDRYLSIHVEKRRWNDHMVLVTYVRDVTDQHQLQLRVEESNRALHQLLANVACGVSVCTIDENGVYTIKYISDGFCSLLEGEKAALLRLYTENPVYGIHPDDQSIYAEFLRSCAKQPCSRELTYRCRTVKGTALWITLRMTIIRDGDALTSYATYFDVTGRMRMQQQLTDVIHNVPGGICMYRWNGSSMEPVLMSEQVCRLFGTDAKLIEQQLRTMDDSMVHPDDVPALRKSVKARLHSTGEEYTYTYRIWNPQKNAYRWLRTASISVPQENGTTIIYVSYSDVTEIKELEQELRQNEEMLQSACDSAHLWSWIYEIPLDRIHCSKMLQEDFGMPEYLEQFPESWFEKGFVLPEYIPMHRERVLAIKNGSMSEEFECRIRHRDGSVHWNRIRLNRLSENSDLAICTAQLIDTEKYLEARIELEEKQQADGGSNLLAHFITNVTRNIPVEHTYLFEESDELLQWNSLQEQLSCTMPMILDEESQETFRKIHDRQNLLRQYAGGHVEQTMEYRRSLPNGKIIWVRTVIHLLQEPKTGDILNYEYIYDIHQQRIYEELMSAVVEFGFELCASLMLDSNQVTVLYSQRQNKPSQLVVSVYTELNRHYADTIVAEDREHYLFASSLENINAQLREKDHFEILHRTVENGVVHYKKDQCYGYSADRSTCLLIRSDVTDIVLSERKKQVELRRALETAEAATLAKSEFLSRMSHEIRTPMNAIMGMTAIAKENRSDFHQVSDCLDKIDMSSHYLLTLINDILEMSRIESGQTEIRHAEFSFDFLMESIRTVVEPLALKSDIRYEFHNHAETESHYLGDAMRIQQVLVNLLSNAIKFTKKGGRVRFSVYIDHQTDAQTDFRFVVADTGIGMRESFMKRMFQPFTQEDGSNTSEYGGSGLGLAISKSLLENMNGKVSVESFLGVGSTFTVTLPLERMHDNSMSVPSEQSAPTELNFELLQGCQVLMAEDHPLNIMVARKLLERKGVIVTVAKNGQLAVQTFTDSVLHFFDAVLMDIRMPVMDGLDATRAIRSLNRPDAATVPIIAMTANALEEDRRHSHEVGMNAHLAKPFEPVQLYAVLTEQIAQARRKTE